MELVDCRCREHQGLGKFGRGSVVEINPQIIQVFISNILRFEFQNILMLLCVAIVTNLCAFSLINYVRRILHVGCSFIYL